MSTVKDKLEEMKHNLQKKENGLSFLLVLVSPKDI